MDFLCLGGQGPPDGSDTEDAEKCPVCLGVPAAGELAMPDSCCHVFCLRCLLTWAEVMLGDILLCLLVRQRRLVCLNVTHHVFIDSVADVSFLPCGQKTLQ